MPTTVGIVENPKTPELATLLGCILDRVFVAGSPCFHGPLNKNIQWVSCPGGDKIVGWATCISKIGKIIPDRLFLASDAFDVILPEAFVATLSRVHAPGLWTFVGPQQFIGNFAWIEGKDAVAKVISFFRERSIEDYVGHPPASLFMDFDIGLPMTLKNVGVPWMFLHETRKLRYLVSPLESVHESRDPMTDCWDRLLMDGCPILQRQRREYHGHDAFLKCFLSHPCGKDTKVIVAYVPRDTLEPASVFGFVIMGEDKDGACLTGIREHYPFVPVMTRAQNRPGTIPYVGDGYMALLRMSSFQKAIVIPDTVLVTGRFDEAIASVKTVAFLWHCEKRQTNDKHASQRQALSSLNPDIRVSVQRLHARGPWMGCFSCATISDLGYLKSLDSKYGLFSSPAYQHVFAVVLQHAHERVMYGVFGNVQNKTHYPMRIC